MIARLLSDRCARAGCGHQLGTHVLIASDGFEPCVSSVCQCPDYVASEGFGGPEAPADDAPASGRPRTWRLVKEDERACFSVVTDEHDGERVVCRLPDGHSAELRKEGTLLAAAPDLLELLKIAADHISQYRDYSESMRAIGRGGSIGSEYTPEYFASMLSDTLRRLA